MGQKLEVYHTFNYLFQNVATISHTYDEDIKHIEKNDSHSNGFEFQKVMPKGEQEMYQSYSAG